MKQLQMRWLGVFMAMLLFVSPAIAFAQEKEEPTYICITSGLPENDGVISTFNSARIVYGEAHPGTIVSVSVCRENRFNRYVEEFYEEIEVGSLGIFSITIPLSEGHNYITLTAQSEGCEEVIYDAAIRRLPEQVRTELQKMIALPTMSVENTLRAVK